MKKGNKIRLKTYEKLASEFGVTKHYYGDMINLNVGYDPGMRDVLGKEVTINEVIDIYKGEERFTILENTNFYFSTEMIEQYENELNTEILHKCIDNLKKTVKERFEDTPCCIYTDETWRIGDKKGDTIEQLIEYLK